MPRESTAGKRWTAFMEQELAHGKRPPGILPVEDLLLYGQHSLLLIAHFPTTTTFSSSPGRALERLTSAFEALSYVHSQGITINLWPYVRYEYCNQAPFVGSYAYWADDPPSKQTGYLLAARRLRQKLHMRPLLEENSHVVSPLAFLPNQKMGAFTLKTRSGPPLAIGHHTKLLITHLSKAHHW
jgi:hypothetical protein